MQENDKDTSLKTCTLGSYLSSKSIYLQHFAREQNLVLLLAHLAWVNLKMHTALRMMYWSLHLKMVFLLRVSYLRSYWPEKQINVYVKFMLYMDEYKFRN